MDQTNFLLYILSQTLSSIRPLHIILLKKWHERFAVKATNVVNIVQFCKDLNLNREQSKKLSQLYNELSPKNESHKLIEQQIQTINIFDDSYPKLLLEIPDPPLIIYCRGNQRLLHSNYTVGVVGSRRATKYGELATQKIINGLTAQPITIISGLAFGVDSFAHNAAITNHLPTIAVLGSGLSDEHIYPRENFQLAQNILTHNGLLLSEYPPNIEARKHQFIARNRIIAGLAQAVIVVEAAQKSGALQTAQFALEYNKSVAAVPGSILSPTSYGTHKLIADGAAIITSSEDILEPLGLEVKINPCEKPTLQYSEPETRVLKYIQQEAIGFDELIQLSQLNVNQLQVTLSALELKQQIKQINPQVYQKIS